MDELASFRLLGPVEVQVEGRLVDVGHARQRLVLAALLLQANTVVPADRLAGCLWGDDPPATSTNLVYGYVSRLRRRLGGTAGLARVPGGYRLEADPDSIDVHRFRRLVAAAGSVADDGRAAALMAGALGLWKGTALTGMAGQWAEAVRVALESERVAAMVDHGAVRLRLGGDATLLSDLRGLLASQPFDERAAELFMRAAYRSGRRAEALDCYHQLRSRLADEIGIEPGPRLQELFQRLLSDDPAPEAPGGTAQPPVPAVPEVRYSLPPDTAAFTGRDSELSQITRVVAGAAGPGGVVAVRAIDGMPGAGKTALAVHAAYVLRDQFPDRQLFINLHAHTPGREPVAPEEALAGLLAALGVDPRALPQDLEGRAAVWRDKLASQRTLLVLDNAATSAQVAPLLPGGRDCLVLVTSRRHLGDLPGMVVPLFLRALPAGEAGRMFTRLAPRAAADPAAVAEVVRLAGYLPLAVSLLARVFTRHPSWTLADLVTDIRESLLTLTAESSSIAAAFGLSYQHLAPAQQRFFALLGLHPGGTTDSYSAAAVAGISAAEAHGLLDGLHGEGLLTETGYRRYGMHDLLRRYARDDAASLPAGTGDQALERLLDYYQHTATIAQDLLARQPRPGPPPATPAPPAAPVLEDAGQALVWIRAERDNLLACLDHTTHIGQHARITALTAALAEVLRRDGLWAEAITRHTTALRSATHLNDQSAQAETLNHLGNVRRLTGDYPAAARDLERALTIYCDLGNQLGQANTLNELGNVRGLTGDYPGAAQALEQALTIHRDLGNQLGQANTLNELGNVRYLTGDYPGAAQALEQALTIHRDLGNQPGQASALNHLGTVRRLTGDYPGAAQALEQALAIYNDLGNQLGQAGVLSNLGTVRSLTGDYPAAARDQEHALTIHRDLGNQLGQANALLYLGSVRRATGDNPGAAQALAQALAIYGGLGDRGGEAETLNETGTLHRISGQLTTAQAYHQRALDLARAIGSANDEAHALAGLGRCAAAAGHTAQATTLLHQAHEILQRTGAAEAATVLAELNATPAPQSKPQPVHTRTPTPNPPLPQ